MIMKPHDCEGLNDAQCLHADLFAERLERCRTRNIGEANAFRGARAAAPHRFPLDPDEVARMDEYIESRFGAPKTTWEPSRRGLSVMVVS